MSNKPTAKGKALLLVTMEAPASFEEEFNDWYDLEHLPQRLAIPGIENGGRFVCLEGWPRWLALYDLTSRAALETPEYLAVSLANATPWSKRVAARTFGRARIVLDQIAPGAASITPREKLSRLAVARFGPLGGERRGQLVKALTRQASELPGILQCRAFTDTTVQISDVWAIAEFGQPTRSDVAQKALGEADGIGAALFNFYGPYHRG
jgi:hypothetical protein